MAKSAGRAFVVKKGGTAIAAVRTKSVTFNGTLIDTTSDDDDGDVTYLANVFASKSLEISVSGLTDGDVLSDLAFSTTDSDKFLSDLTLERPNGDVVAGTFVMTNYAENGSYDGPVEFTATLVRSGAHTFTPAA
jgi:predicted secreted protein